MTRRHIALVIIIVLVITAGLSGYYGPWNPRLSLRIEYVEPLRPLPELENITFGEGFVLPENETGPIRVLEVDVPVLTEEDAIALLKVHDLYEMEDGVVTEPSDYALNRHGPNTMVGLIYSHATLYFDYFDYDAGAPSYTDAQVEQDPALLNITEGLPVAIGHLREHDFYDPSWHLNWCFKQVLNLSMEGFSGYQYIFVPVVSGRVLCDLSIPCLSIWLTPEGRMVGLRADLRGLQLTEEIGYQRFPDPVMALQELDSEMLMSYYSIDRLPVEVRAMVPGYRYEGDPGQCKAGEALRAFPCWTFYCGHDGRIVINV